MPVDAGTAFDGSVWVAGGNVAGLGRFLQELRADRIKTCLDVSYFEISQSMAAVAEWKFSHSITYYVCLSATTQVDAVVG